MFANVSPCVKAWVQHGHRRKRGFSQLHALDPGPSWNPKKCQGRVLEEWVQQMRRHQISA